MATISSPGIGSGIDVRTIVAQLVSLEKQPLGQLQKAAATIDAKLSAYGQLKSQISNLNDQASKLADTQVWQAMKLTSSNAAISGTATNSAAAAVFSMEVSQLARPQTTATSTVTTGTAVGAGTLTITLGTWSGTGFDGTLGGPTFTPGSGSAIPPITVSATDKLSDVASKINAANAGVSATVLKDSTGERLLMRSSATGVASAFRIEVTDADGNLTDNSGLSRLGFDPENSLNNLALTQSAKDTEATLNGVPIRSSNDQFSNLLEGVTLTVAQTTSTPVTVQVGKDPSAARTNINNFVSSFNALANALREMTKYNPSDKTAGTLQGEGTALNLQSALRSLVGSNGPTGNAFGRISDLGLEMQADGTLKVNETKLTAALNKGSELQAFFTADTGNNSNNGMGLRLKNFAAGLLASDGLFSSKTKSLESIKARNTKDQDKVNDRVGLVERRLLAQYNRMDANVAKLNALNSYVAQQVTTWNNQRNN